MLTGEYQILSADIVYDAGTSLNPAVDIGQLFKIIELIILIDLDRAAYVLYGVKYIDLVSLAPFSGQIEGSFVQGEFQLLPPAPPYYPLPRGKIHPKGYIWSFTVG